MDKQQDDKLKASEALLIISRVWLFLSLGALFLYFVVLAIENSGGYLPLFRSTVHVSIPGYRVPIEKEEESGDGDDRPDN